LREASANRLLDLLRGRGRGHERGEPLDQLRGEEGLLDVVVGADREGEVAVELSGPRADQERDHQPVARVLAQGPHDLVAGQYVHRDLEDCRFGADPPDQLESLTAVAGRRDRVAGPLTLPRKQRGGFGIGIGHEDSRALNFQSGHGLPRFRRAFEVRIQGGLPASQVIA
jgi:hypothetical protein